MTRSLLDLSRAIPRPVLGAPIPAERLQRRIHPAVERAAAPSPTSGMLGSCRPLSKLTEVESYGDR
jgi:hypothetical protein